MIVDIPTIERLCATSCFVLLFGTTLYYWSLTLFSMKTSYTQAGLIGYASALFCLTVHLVLRWIDSGHFPLSNLYESLIFLAWCLLILHIYFERTLKTFFLGVLTAPAILCVVAFTDFSLPVELQQSNPLVPALQSNWLIMHVTVMIASYAALLIGCLVAIAYLIFSQFSENKKSGSVNSSRLSISTFSLNSNSIELPLSSSQKQEVLDTSLENPFQQNQITSQLEFARKELNFLLFLDNLSYRTIGIGFCFLTLGILSGAVWANETWGNYWSWDPKETWALITWLTFAVYLHSRLIGGWTGSRPAWVASFGFVIVWVCYLGVNLLGQGLHSYGFLNL